MKESLQEASCYNVLTSMLHSFVLSSGNDTRSIPKAVVVIYYRPSSPLGISVCCLFNTPENTDDTGKLFAELLK